jgi:Predicted membrane protein
MKNLLVFFVRGVVISFGLWICIKLFGHVDGEYTIGMFLLGGFIFTLVNTIIRPIVTLFSLPMILLTMGLFTLIVNGVMVYIAISFTPGLEMGFWGAVVSGIVMTLVNYVVNVTLQSYNE